MKRRACAVGAQTKRSFLEFSIFTQSRVQGVGFFNEDFKVTRRCHSFAGFFLCGEKVDLVR